MTLFCDVALLNLFYRMRKLSDQSTFLGKWCVCCVKNIYVSVAHAPQGIYGIIIVYYVCECIYVTALLLQCKN